MDRPTSPSRRTVLPPDRLGRRPPRRWLGWPFRPMPQISVAAYAAPVVDPWRGLKVGIASYSFLQFDRADAIKGINRVGAHYVSIKDKQACIAPEFGLADRKWPPGISATPGSNR